MRETYFPKYDPQRPCTTTSVFLLERPPDLLGMISLPPSTSPSSPGESIKIPTGIQGPHGTWLVSVRHPKSGLGTKYRLQLDNTAFAIDRDYYNSDNEGHIFVKLTNSTLDNRGLSLRAGDKFVRGIFLPYGITYSDNAVGERNGGFGSTGR